MKTKSFAFILNIPSRRLAEIVDDAFGSGGVGYWATVADYSDRPAGAKCLADYPFCGGWIQLEITEESGGDRLPPLDEAAIRRGLDVLAKSYPRHFADIVSGDSDSTTADALVQAAVLGEIVFG